MNYWWCQGGALITILLSSLTAYGMKKQTDCEYMAPPLLRLRVIALEVCIFFKCRSFLGSFCLLLFQVLLLVFTFPFHCIKLFPKMDMTITMTVASVIIVVIVIAISIIIKQHLWLIKNCMLRLGSRTLCDFLSRRQYKKLPTIIKPTGNILNTNFCIHILVNSPPSPLSSPNFVLISDIYSKYVCFFHISEIFYLIKLLATTRTLSESQSGGSRTIT